MALVRSTFALIALILTSSAGRTQTTTPGSRPTEEPVARLAFIATMDTEFKKMDADKNSVLTRKEIDDFERIKVALAARQRNGALFRLLDSDKNGLLTAGEFASLPMNMPTPDVVGILSQTDSNHDGKVTLIEFRSGKLVNFDRMDSDKDGIVSVSEMRAAGIIR